MEGSRVCESDDPILNLREFGRDVKRKSAGPIFRADSCREGGRSGGRPGIRGPARRSSRSARTFAFAASLPGALPACPLGRVLSAAATVARPLGAFRRAFPVLSRHRSPPCEARSAFRPEVRGFGRTGSSTSIRPAPRRIRTSPIGPWVGGSRGTRGSPSFQAPRSESRTPCNTPRRSSLPKTTAHRFE